MVVFKGFVLRRDMIWLLVVLIGIMDSLVYCHTSLHSGAQYIEPCQYFNWLINTTL